MSDETKPPAGPEPPAEAGATIEQTEPAPAAEAEPSVILEPSAVAQAAQAAAESGEAGPPAPPERPASARPRAVKGPRPVLTESREPLFHEEGGFRMRLDPADLARLRELPGSKGRTDRELGEEFFEKQASRFAQSLAEDVRPPAEVRVVVDPYSRQAFLAIERTIRSILSF